jgi:Glu-tRNA(Gln) amidotransferase subunit E-like FAD-binding protein
MNRNYFTGKEVENALELLTKSGKFTINEQQLKQQLTTLTEKEITEIISNLPKEKSDEIMLIIKQIK